MENYTELIETLRNKKSRDNRELFDKAASAIEELANEHIGKWCLEKDNWGLIVRCDRCDTRFAEPMIPFAFCPNCGARMENK